MSEKAVLRRDEILDLAVTKLQDADIKVTKAQAKALYGAIIDEISNGLVEGRKVALNGLGNFEVKDREARKGRHPLTGETLDIPASKRVRFKASKIVKEAVNA